MIANILQVCRTADLTDRSRDRAVSTQKRLRAGRTDDHASSRSAMVPTQSPTGTGGESAAALK